MIADRATPEPFLSMPLEKRAPMANSVTTGVARATRIAVPLWASIAVAIVASAAVGHATTGGPPVPDASGVETGRDEQVPLATFERAWAPNHNSAIVTRTAAR